MPSAKREPRLSHAWFDAVKHSVARLDTALADINSAPGAEALLENLRAVVDNAEAQIHNSEHVYQSLAELGDEADALKGSMSEMIRLEERMKGIIHTGTRLVRRLRPSGKMPLYLSCLYKCTVNSALVCSNLIDSIMI